MHKKGKTHQEASIKNNTEFCPEDITFLFKNAKKDV